MSIKITAPVRQEGEVTSAFGPHSITFKNGVADVDFELSDGLLMYLSSNGYGIGDDAEAAAPAATPEPPDPRDPAIVEAGGTPLRDAAVDPRASDFLPPTNAGEANPHGSQVVAPGIHALAPGPIVPGTVGSPDYQQEKETFAAEAVLVENEDVRKVTAGLNAMARAEYDKTKATGQKAGLAQELTDNDEVTASHFTAEERALLGLDADADEPVDIDEVVVDSEDELAPTPAPADAETPVEDLKGEALTDALKNAGLPVSGSADEKRARLAEHRNA